MSVNETSPPEDQDAFAGFVDALQPQGGGDAPESGWSRSTCDQLIVVVPRWKHFGRAPSACPTTPAIAGVDSPP